MERKYFDPTFYICAALPDHQRYSNLNQPKFWVVFIFSGFIPRNYTESLHLRDQRNFFSDYANLKKCSKESRKKNPPLIARPGHLTPLELYGYRNFFSLKKVFFKFFFLNGQAFTPLLMAWLLVGELFFADSSKITNTWLSKTAKQLSKMKKKKMRQTSKEAERRTWRK